MWEMDLFRWDKDMKGVKKMKDKVYQFKQQICNSIQTCISIKIFCKIKKKNQLIARSFASKNKHCNITTCTFLGIYKSLQQYQ
jgi:hypothetical protein